MEEMSETLGMMEVESSMEEQQQKTAGSVEATEKASGRQGGGLFDLARRGLDILREKLQGRAVWKNSEDGRLIVKEKSVAESGQEEEIRLEEIIEEGEEVTVEIEKAEEVVQEGKEGSSYSGTAVGYGFLDELGDEELESRNKENRKRKGGGREGYVESERAEDFSGMEGKS